MTVFEVRQDIHSFVDSMSEQELYALYNMLCEEYDDIPSEEELRSLERCRYDREYNPDSFVSWKDLKVAV